jgi:integrase
MFAQSWEHHAGRSYLGAALSPGCVNAKLDEMCAAAKVPRITVHGLRHTCATLLLAAGVPPHVVQRRLGHKRVEMTLNQYAHVLPSMQADAAARLALLLHQDVTA